MIRFNILKKMAAGFLIQMRFLPLNRNCGEDWPLFFDQNRTKKNWTKFCNNGEFFGEMIKREKRSLEESGMEM